MKKFVVSSWDGAHLQHGWWKPGGHPFVYQPVEHEASEANMLATTGNLIWDRVTGDGVSPRLLVLTRSQLLHFIPELAASASAGELPN